jgi:hypothetical protein
METEEKIKFLLSQQTTVGREPFDGRGFYAASSNNRYAIYSISIDRFILIDSYDLWMTLTCAKLLSAKIPLAVFAISDEVPSITQDDCIFWTITNKQFHQSEGQTPVLAKLTSADSVNRDGAPIDYIDDEQIAMLVTLQNYAMFVQRVLYALHLADASVNPDDHFFFSRLIDGNISDVLEIKPDGTAIKNGSIIEIHRVLYMSQSIDEAMSRINALWSVPRWRDIEHRTLFYKFLGCAEPEIIRNNIPAI